MMMHKIDQAMVLAAGLGKRMRPLTDRTPKPLLVVNGKTMLDRALDKLIESDVTRAVVNHHHLGEQIVSHLQDRARPEIVFSDETDMLLETGGGVRKAVAKFGGESFFIINADMIWHDGDVPMLQRMKSFWNPAIMDCLVLLQPLEKVVGSKNKGDYNRAEDGRITRSHDNGDYMFAGVQIVHPRLYLNAPGGAFSQNILFDEAEAQGRLYGLVHDDLWFHVSKPEDITAAESVLRQAEAA